MPVGLLKYLRFRFILNILKIFVMVQTVFVFAVIFRRCFTSLNRSTSPLIAYKQENPLDYMACNSTINLFFRNPFSDTELALPTFGGFNKLMKIGGYSIENLRSMIIQAIRYLNFNL